MKSVLKKHKFFIAALVFLLVFYLWTAAQIPYTHDDWDWGLEMGVEHLLTADINSRYAGNLTEVIITRSTVLKTLVMGLVFTLIPAAVTVFACKLLAAKESKPSDLLMVSVFFFSNLMILLLPKDVWQQTNGWVAGFSNFVVSGLALLAYFLVLLDFDLHKNNTDRPRWKSIGLFAFGLAMQLFLENLAVYFLLFSVFFLIARCKQKEIVRRMIPLLLGNLLGMMIMFSSSIYSSLWNTGYAIGTYRHLMYDAAKPLHVFVLQAGIRYLGVFVPQIVGHDGILMGCIAGLMAIAVVMKKKKLAAVILSAFNVVFCIYYFYSFFQGNPFESMQRDFGYTVLRPVVTGIDCLFVVFVGAEAIVLFRENGRLLFWLLAIWLSPFFIMGPMLLINTVGPRCFYTTDVCFVLFGGILLCWIASKKPISHIAVMSVIFLLAVSVLCVSWIKIYEPIGKHSRERERMIEAVVSGGGSRIRFSEYPNEEYLWLPDPVDKDSWRVPVFKEFYHIPETVEIWFDIWDD